MIPPIPTAVLELPPNLVRAYLGARGWRLADRPLQTDNPAGERLFAKRWSAPRTFDLFLSNDPSQLELVVPRDGRASDYQRRVQDTLRTLEGVEDRSSAEIAAEILFINFDLVKSALSNSYLLYEAIPLDFAIGHVGRMRDLLSSSATTEIHPQAFYGRVRRAAAEYSSSCLFGHTFKGSFGFTVQSPLTVPDLQPGLFGEEVPFERKVLTRLVNGLESVSAAQRSNNLELAMDPESGLSANGFDILADLVEGAGGKVSLEVAFSRLWRSPQEGPRVESFEFSQDAVDVSREAAEKLRGTYEPTHKTILGRVITLRNTTDPSKFAANPDAREVSIDFEDEDLGAIKVRVLLNAEDYLKAIEAHRSGSRIAVDGLLEKRGSRYIVESPVQVRSA